MKKIEFWDVVEVFQYIAVVLVVVFFLYAVMGNLVFIFIGIFVVLPYVITKIWNFIVDKVNDS